MSERNTWLSGLLGKKKPTSTEQAATVVTGGGGESVPAESSPVAPVEVVEKVAPPSDERKEVDQPAMDKPAPHSSAVQPLTDALQAYLPDLLKEEAVTPEQVQDFQIVLEKLLAAMEQREKDESQKSGLVRLKDAIQKLADEKPELAEELQLIIKKIDDYRGNLKNYLNLQLGKQRAISQDATIDQVIEQQIARSKMYGFNFGDNFFADNFMARGTSNLVATNLAELFYGFDLNSLKSNPKLWSAGSSKELDRAGMESMIPGVHLKLFDRVEMRQEFQKKESIDLYLDLPAHNDDPEKKARLKTILEEAYYN